MAGKLAIVFALSVSSVVAQSKSDVQWRTHFDSAAELARQTGKPLLIEFWASWCQPCQRMDTDVWPHPRVVALSRNYVCVSVDADRDTSTPARFAVNALPTVVLADPWGKAIIKREGYITFPDLIGMLQTLPPDFTEIKEAREALERDRKDVKALCLVADFYARHGACELSNQHYREALKTKEVKSDLKLHQDLDLAIALNYVKQASWNDARKVLEQFLREHPEPRKEDQALFCLTLALVKSRKTQEAQKMFEKLAAKYPDSEATLAARKLLNPPPR